MEALLLGIDDEKSCIKLNASRMKVHFEPSKQFWKHCQTLSFETTLSSDWINFGSHKKSWLARFQFSKSFSYQHHRSIKSKTITTTNSKNGLA